MKKILLIISLLIVLVGCSELSVNGLDVTSGATSKYNKNDNDEVTKANKQFGELSSSQSTDTRITEIRSEVESFINSQFLNTKEIDLSNMKYEVNEKSMSTIFDNQAQHSMKDTGYDYTIKIKQLDKNYSEDEFIKTLQKKNNSLKILESNELGKVLVKTNGGYDSQIHGMIDINENSFYFEIDSKKLSIPELVLIAEKFVKKVK